MIMMATGMAVPRKMMKETDQKLTPGIIVSLLNLLVSGLKWALVFRQLICRKFYLPPVVPVQKGRFSPVKTKAEITGYPAGAICTPGSLPGIPPFWENISFTAISRLKFKTILA